MKTQKPDTTIAALLAAHAETISAPALLAAVEKHEKERQAAEAERALRFFTEGQSQIAASVQRLRDLRKKEEKEKKTLLALNAAMEAFKKDGDTVKFQKAQEAALELRF